MKKLLFYCFIFGFLFKVSAQDISVFDSLFLVLKKSRSDTDKVNIYCELCTELDNAGLSDSGIYYGLQGLAIAQRAGNILQQAKAHRKIGNAYFSLGEYDKDLYHQNLSLKLCRSINNKKGIAAALGNIGIVYQTRGEYEKALDFQEQSLKIEEELNNKKGVGTSLDNIGNIYYNLGDVPKAMKYRQKAIDIQESIGDKEGLATTLTNYAGDHYALADYPKAIEFNQKALKMMEELGNKYAMAIILSNIGNVYLERSDDKQAIFYYKKSLKLSEEIEDKYGASLLFNNLGDVYKNIKDYMMALYYYNRSLALCEEIDNKSGLIDGWLDLGDLDLRQKKPDAIKTLLKAYNLAKEINKASGVSNALIGMADYYLLNGNNDLCIQKANEALTIAKSNNDHFTEKEANHFLYLAKKGSDPKGALIHYERYVELRDTLFSSERAKIITQKEMQYQFNETQMKQKAAQDKKDLETKKEKQKQNLIILFVSVGLLVVIIFLYILFTRFRLIQKQKRVIEIQKTEVELQKHVVEEKNHEIEEKQKEILDSINYAKRIQYTLLAHSDFLNQNLPDHFVYFNPKDIVSGDFYWAAKRDGKFYIAACDSTGHGVPGAFMSLLNIGFLSEAINEKGILHPNEVLNFVRQRLIDNISKEGQKDGFDGILVCIDQLSGKITYAAANNAPVLVRDGELLELDADKMPVGIGERKEDFKLYEPEIKKGDMLYLYTDGFADQFGGPKGKKFMYKKMDELIKINSEKPLEDQKNILIKAFEDWKGGLEQVDDVCVIGIRI